MADYLNHARSVAPRAPVPLEDEQFMTEEEAIAFMSLSISQAATQMLTPIPEAEEPEPTEREYSGDEIFEPDELTFDDDVPPEPPQAPSLAHLEEGDCIAEPLADQSATGRVYHDAMIAAHSQFRPSQAPTSAQRDGAGTGAELPEAAHTPAGLMRLPSPWRAIPPEFVVEDPNPPAQQPNRAEPSKGPMAALKEALRPRRHRSLSSIESPPRKISLSSLSILPSLPKPSSVLSSIRKSSIFSSSESKGKSSHRSDPKPKGDYLMSIGPTILQLPDPDQPREEQPNEPPSVERWLSSVRRVASGGSRIFLTDSRQSSLGDDSRFADQSTMVNSRMRAIKDSVKDVFQDRTRMLPKISSMPNIVPNPVRKKLSLTSNSLEVPATSGNPPPVSTLGGKEHDALDRAIKQLTGDIVVMGGYRGSILESAQPPHKRLWLPFKVGLNLRQVDLEVGLNPKDEERMEEHVRPGGMVEGYGMVDISGRLIKRLRESEPARSGRLRVHVYSYDWRLSPHLLSRQLIEFLEKLPSNQPGVSTHQRGATVIAHSLGGLITRHAVNQRPGLFAGVVYAGVPQSCVNILGPLRNGDDVLYNSRVLTAQVNFTFRTSFLLLPLDGKCFVDKQTGEEYKIEFFDVNDWIKYRLSPCIEPPLPPLQQPSTGILSTLKKSASLQNLSLPRVKASLPNVSLPKILHSRHKSKDSKDDSPHRPYPPRQHDSSTSGSSAETAATSTNSTPPPSRRGPTDIASTAAAAIEAPATDALAPDLAHNRPNPMSQGKSPSTTRATAVTLPRAACLAYLRRTLAEVKRFKLEMAHNPEHDFCGPTGSSNLYPPVSVLYSKSLRTVSGATVPSLSDIRRADAFSSLIFRSGDGVCLAEKAMVPPGYRVIVAGRVSSKRGHVTLLSDLEGIGRCLLAIKRGRGLGVGLGDEGRVLGRGYRDGRDWVEGRGRDGRGVVVVGGVYERSEGGRGSLEGDGREGDVVG